MGEKIEVLFARSFTYPDTIVVEEVSCVGYIEYDEGNKIIPEYNASAESWMARTDMSCSIYTVPKSSFDVLSQKYKDFIKASWEEPCDEEKVENLKQEFLLMVNKK